MTTLKKSVLQCTCVSQSGCCQFQGRVRLGTQGESLRKGGVVRKAPT